MFGVIFKKTKCPESAGYDEQRDAPASSPGVAAGGAARFELPLAGAEAMGSRQGSQLRCPAPAAALYLTATVH